MARIVALPEPHVAVLQLSTEVKGVSGGPPDSYFYTDPRGLVWDSRLGHWSKDELGSDLSVGRLHTGKEYNVYMYMYTGEEYNIYIQYTGKEYRAFMYIYIYILLRNIEHLYVYILYM